MAVLSPKFEVQPQSGGHWLRTSEPGRTVLSALALENLSPGRICRRIPRAPARFKKQCGEMGSTSHPRLGILSLPGDHSVGPAGPQPLMRGLAGGAPLGWQLPASGCGLQLGSLRPRGGGTWHTSCCRRWLGFAMLGVCLHQMSSPFLLPVCPQIIPDFVEEGMSSCSGSGVQDPLLTLECRSRWPLSTNPHSGRRHRSLENARDVLLAGRWGCSQAAVTWGFCLTGWQSTCSPRTNFVLLPGGTGRTTDVSASTCQMRLQCALGWWMERGTDQGGSWPASSRLSIRWSDGTVSGRAA